MGADKETAPSAIPRIVPGDQVRCPGCQKLLFKTVAGTRVSALPVMCSRCGRGFELNIAPIEAQSPRV